MADEVKVASLLKGAWTRIMGTFRDDCCILAARIAIDVFDRFRVVANALSCQVTIFNAIMYKRMCEEGHLPRNPQERDQWFDSGSWSIGIGFGVVRERGGKYSIRNDPGKWNGHVVATFYDEEGPLLLDLTLGQANRPQGGIILGPTLLRTEPEFVRTDDGSFTVDLPQPNGADPILLSYRSRLNDTSFTTKPDWQGYTRRIPVVDRLVADIWAHWDKEGV